MLSRFKFFTALQLFFIILSCRKLLPEAKIIRAAK